MRDPVARSDALDADVDEAAIINTLVSVGRSNRRYIRGLAASVALDIGLSIAMAFIAFNAQQTAETATSASTQARLQCIAGNDSRAGQLRLWLYILSFPSQSGESAAQRRQQVAEAKQFKAYVEKLFAPRDCSKPQALKNINAPATNRAVAASPAPTPQPQLTPTVFVTTTTPVVIVERSNSPNQGGTPSSRPTETASHSPSPSPSRTCLLGLICRPLPIGASLE